jgi:hypothetical protein
MIRSCFVRAHFSAVARPKICGSLFKQEVRSQEPRVDLDRLRSVKHASLEFVASCAFKLLLIGCQFLIADPKDFVTKVPNELTQHVLNCRVSRIRQPSVVILAAQRSWWKGRIAAHRSGIDCWVVIMSEKSLFFAGH